MKMRVHKSLNSFIAIIAAVSIAVLGICATELEDKLETEIDLRDPSIFINDSSIILSIRPTFFTHLTYNTSGVISTGSPLDGGTFGRRYWYETRDKNVMCPSTPMAIAAHCDWALMIPCLFTGPHPELSPRTIYVHPVMLPHFVESTLAGMNKTHRFVLVTGGSDGTIPRAFYGDHDFRGFNGDMKSYWGRLLNDERLIHWFAENHDLNHPKLSSLPTAFVYNGRDSLDDTSDHPDRDSVTEISKRPLRFIVSDKVRTGTGPWADRQTVMNFCEKNQTLCFLPPKTTFDRVNGVAHKDFLRMVVSYPFIACVHGAGIDPSPKAWEALLVGTIPIIQHSTLDDAYERLPVMFVNEWSDLFQPDSEDLLRRWLAKLAPYYQEGSELRKQTLHRLTTAYWVELFHHKYNKHFAELNNYSGARPHNHSSLHHHHHTGNNHSVPSAIAAADQPTAV